MNLSFIQMREKKYTPHTLSKTLQQFKMNSFNNLLLQADLNLKII